MTEKKRKTNQRCGSPLHLYACVLVRCALLLVIIGRISESEREEKVLIPLLLHNVFPGEAIIIRWAGELSITQPSSAPRSFLFFPCLILIFSPLFLLIWKALINELLPALSLLVYQASSTIFGKEFQFVLLAFENGICLFVIIKCARNQTSKEPFFGIYREWH